MRKWRCKYNCQFPGQTRRRGGVIYEFNDDVTPPHHFELVEEDKPVVLTMRNTRSDMVDEAVKRGVEVKDEMTKQEILDLLEGGK